jgi:hypothetical protein
VLEEAACLADDGTKLELGGLKMGSMRLRLPFSKGAKQPIVPPIISLRLGYSDIPRMKLGSAQWLYCGGSSRSCARYKCEFVAD